MTTEMSRAWRHVRLDPVAPAWISVRDALTPYIEAGIVPGTVVFWAPTDPGILLDPVRFPATLRLCRAPQDGTWGVDYAGPDSEQSHGVNMDWLLGEQLP
jgi:hypothetical protein